MTWTSQIFLKMLINGSGSHLSIFHIRSRSIDFRNFHRVTVQVSQWNIIERWYTISDDPRRNWTCWHFGTMRRRLPKLASPVFMHLSYKHFFTWSFICSISRHIMLSGGILHLAHKTQNSSNKTIERCCPVSLPHLPVVSIPPPHLTFT